MKDEFISTVSHELRTPLTSIRGALGLLSSGVMGELNEKAGNLLRIASSNTDRLVRLINDILDLERMESGRAPLHFREVETGGWCGSRWRRWRRWRMRRGEAGRARAGADAGRRPGPGAAGADQPAEQRHQVFAGGDDGGGRRRR